MTLCFTDQWPKKSAPALKCRSRRRCEDGAASPSYPETQALTFNTTTFNIPICFTWQRHSKIFLENYSNTFLYPIIDSIKVYGWPTEYNPLIHPAWVLDFIHPAFRTFYITLIDHNHSIISGNTTSHNFVYNNLCLNSNSEKCVNQRK